MIFNFYKSVSNSSCALIDDINNQYLYYNYLYYDIYDENKEKYTENKIYLDSNLKICLKNITHNTIIQILKKTDIPYINIDYYYKGFKYDTTNNKINVLFWI
jgi:hypothetical protein